MAKRVTITFPCDRPYDFYTQVFWFAEALYSPIVSAGLGTLNDIDHAREVIWIDLNDKHDLGKVKGIVRKTLARHVDPACARVDFVGGLARLPVAV